MPYIAKKAYREQTEVVGNGQCVSLVKALTGAPPSSLWKEGQNVCDVLKEKRIIPEGTAIATFVDGRYPNHAHGNHAALFIRVVAGGIEVYDQWTGQNPGVRILSIGRPAKLGAKRAEAYSIVL